MSLVIRFEGVEEFQAKLDQLKYDMETAQLAISAAVDDAIMPAVEERSQTVWGVRTGQYSSSWYKVDTLNGVEVGNDAPYASPLEHGWTTKRGNQIYSPGVLYTVIRDNFYRFVEVVEDWMRRVVTK